MNMLSDKSIAAFLYFGYVPQVKINFSTPPWSLINKNSNTDPINALTEKDLITGGVKALKNAISSTIKDCDHEAGHFLPLSGGLDSRAILGGLLENLNPSQIHTVTFGMPATWDFKIGNKVANYAGVRHESIDFSRILWNQSDLETFAARFESPIPLFECFLFDQIYHQFSYDMVYWSGYMGDPLAGSHLLDTDSPSWDIAIQRFVNRSRYAKSALLVGPEFNPKDLLPALPLMNNSILSYDEQIDFAIRQEGYIKQVVMPKNYDVRMPFLDSHWVDFILTVPREFRIQQYLYKKILIKAFPVLFALPVKNNQGLPLNALPWQHMKVRISLNLHSKLRQWFPSANRTVHPAINYIDFNEGLRSKIDLKNVVFNNLNDLKKRQIVDSELIDLLWGRHQKKGINHSDALLLLASLEIFLKSKKICQ